MKDHTTMKTPFREIFNSMSTINDVRSLNIKWTRTEWNLITAYGEMLSDKAKELGYK